MFDVEAFAKIELTVWPTYALGGGLGTKAAAANLARRGVNWFSNFFDANGHKYVDGGGNGAAMRIQPHVWAMPLDSRDLLPNVLRNALVTHGHPHGFCGAVLHALALESTLREGAVPAFSKWGSFIDRFVELPQLISNDPQLAAFWQSAWESAAQVSLISALEAVRSDAFEDLRKIEPLVSQHEPSNYHKILDQLGCLTPKFRGSGLKTVIASMALAELFRHERVEDALISAANELESDTDTIATMAGALLGAVSSSDPTWPIQDREYISRETSRLAGVSAHIPQTSFTYPDLGRWNPPAKQNASIGSYGDGLAIVGLGKLLPFGNEYQMGDAIWQWSALEFGQSILAKRKAGGKQKISANQLPGTQQDAQKEVPHMRQIASSSAQTKLPLSLDRDGPSGIEPHRPSRDSIDRLSDEAIASGFDDVTLGRLLNQCIDATNSVDAAVGFAAIVAKAKLARARRRK